MRFLFSSLVLLSISSISSVSAACSGAYVDGSSGVNDFRPVGLVTPALGGEPASDALPLFWTGAVSNGNFAASASFSGGGLGALDKFCNREADINQYQSFDPPTATVQARKGLYKAIASSVSVNAYDRFAAVDQEQTIALGRDYDVVDANGKCIANRVGDLFLGVGYTLDLLLADQSGILPTDLNSTIPLFTGSTTEGKRWYTTVPNNGDPATNEGATSAQLSGAYCGSDGTDGWNSATAGTTSVGYLFSDTNALPGRWLGAQVSGSFTNTKGCSNGLHILCLQASPQAPTGTPGGTGDPQLTGLQGQSFQVHGMPEEYFNLISLPDMQLNSRFTYLASGQCNYNNTECWTHPGTYVDQLGFMFPGLQIKAIAGQHEQGMTVYINDKKIVASAGEISTHHSSGKHSHAANQTTQIVTVSFLQDDVVTITSPLFTITATNSDMFFNFGLSLHSPSLLRAGSHLHHIRSTTDATTKYPSFPLHGLLGQTWKNARYSNGRLFAGSVDDYMMLDSKLFSTKFVYNQYQH